MLFLAPNESIRAVYRPHLLIVLGSSIPTFLVLLAPFLMLPFLPEEITLPSFGVIPEGVIVPVAFDISLLAFLLSLWALVLWMRLFFLWSRTRLEAVVITDARIIRIAPKSFFRFSSSSIPLDLTDEVAYEQDGKLAHFFNFGSVRVQTTGQSREFVADYIPHPEDMKKTLKEVREKALKRKRSDDAVIFDDEENMLV